VKVDLGTSACLPAEAALGRERGAEGRGSCLLLPPFKCRFSIRVGQILLSLIRLFKNIKHTYIFK
jgi:hypothetical protein